MESCHRWRRVGRVVACSVVSRDGLVHALAVKKDSVLSLSDAANEDKCAELTGDPVPDGMCVERKGDAVEEGMLAELCGFLDRHDERASMTAVAARPSATHGGDGGRTTTNNHEQPNTTNAQTVHRHTSSELVKTSQD